MGSVAATRGFTGPTAAKPSREANFPTFENTRNVQRDADMGIVLRALVSAVESTQESFATHCDARWIVLDTDHVCLGAAIAILAGRVPHATRRIRKFRAQTTVVAEEPVFMAFVAAIASSLGWIVPLPCAQKIATGRGRVCLANANVMSHTKESPAKSVISISLAKGEGKLFADS
jgi:hypothetical protein